MFPIHTADLIIAPIVFAVMVLFMAGFLTCALNYEHNWLSKLSLKVVSIDECMVIGAVAMVICVFVYFSFWISVCTGVCLMATYGIVRWCHETYESTNSRRIKK